MIKHILAAALMAVCVSVVAKDFGTYPIQKGNILEVYDGDTIYITDKTCPPVFCEKIGVRVYGIDTPEMHSKCPKEHDLAVQAKGVMSDAIANSKKIELRHATHEKFGRLMGQLYIDDQNIGDILVQKKLAVPYFGEKKTTDWCK